jgi:aquaporin Z
MSTPKLLTEFIGTFFLVLIIAGVSGASAPIVVGALSIGLILMAMVYMGGHISGAHYNPAVSLAVYMRGGMTAGQMLAYWVTQIAAGITAALVGAWLIGEAGGIAPGTDVDVVRALTVEVLFSFALALVVLNVAVAQKNQGNSFYGLAIGMTVAAAAIVTGGVSGGAFNPAVGIGMTTAGALVGGLGWVPVWLYVVGPLIGGALGAVVFGIQERAAPETA